MASQSGGDIYAWIKHHIFQIFVLLLTLFGMYKVLKVEYPHSTPVPPAVQSPQPVCVPC